MKYLAPSFAVLILAGSSLAMAGDNKVSFEDLDTDQSGALSLEEAQSAGVEVEAFNQYDTDANGEWSEEEFMAVIQAQSNPSETDTTTPEY